MASLQCKSMAVTDFHKRILIKKVLTLSTLLMKRHFLLHITQSLTRGEEVQVLSLWILADVALLQIHNAFEVPGILNQGTCITKGATVKLTFSYPVDLLFFLSYHLHMTDV